MTDSKRVRTRRPPSQIPESGRDRVLRRVASAGTTVASETPRRGGHVFLAENGFLSPSVDDVLRLVILALAAVNVVVLLAAVRTLRQSTRILLDVEQFAREVRKETRALREPAGTDI